MIASPCRQNTRGILIWTWLRWRGKDEQDWSDLVLNAPPLWIHGEEHPRTGAVSWKFSNTLEWRFSVEAFRDAVSRAGRVPAIFNRGSRYAAGR
jgi:hypothetical protein